ncbi:MAG: 3-methyladenine DNA glycosylase [Chloroflexota bacterium]
MIHFAVPTPSDFVFKATVESHGWYQLVPFHYDHETGILARPFLLSNGKTVRVHMRGGKGNVVLVDVIGRPLITSRDRNAIITAVKHIFNLNTRLTDFYDTMQKTDGYAWVAEKKVGRLLASPTVWEDVVKTLTTTNVSWENTVKMCAKLSALDENGIFPSPDKIVSMDADTLAEKTGLGYRAPYLHELATRITEDDAPLAIESWRQLASDDLYKAIMDLSGFGDYAAGTVMRLLGHYDKLAIDTVARKAFEHVTGNPPESDTDIRDYYADFGKWRGLVLWMDCIRDETEDAPQPIES